MNILLPRLGGRLFAANRLGCFQLSVASCRQVPCMCLGTLLSGSKDSQRFKSHRSGFSSVISETRSISLPSFDLGLKNTLLKLFRKILMVDREKSVQMALKWYRSLDKVDYEEFLFVLDLPDTFTSWVKIRQLHVWMILVHLMQAEGLNRYLRRTLIQIMWEDIVTRAKTISTQKQRREAMRLYGDEFRTLLFAYDEALLSTDQVFCDALWYYFFDGKCEDPCKMEILISYIRYQVNELLQHKSDSELDNIWHPITLHVRTWSGQKKIRDRLAER